MSNTNSTHTHSLSLLARIAIGAVVLAAFVAAGMMVAGCGSHDERAQAPEVAPSQGAEGSTVVAALPGRPLPSATSWAGHASSLGDSLPPEVAVSVEDTLVDAGDVIEITARGSDDVSQMGLSDAIGRVQLFTQNTTDGTWHVLYRVPLGGSKERIGLSVTAMNDVNRWRRVWVFLKIRSPETPEATTSSDSSTHE